MEEIWMKACTHYVIPEMVAKTWYERIQQRLSDTSATTTRCYHNWQEMMLHKYEHLQHCKPCIVLAAFFQYYTFDGNRNCVKENCAAFEEFCSEAMFEEEAKNVILRLLGQKPVEEELVSCIEDDANLLQDLDLVILAATPEFYKNYTQLLRREYLNMNDETYKLMRLKVLEALLMIPNIFSTQEFQIKYEATARSNIKQEINELKA